MDKLITTPNTRASALPSTVATVPGSALAVMDFGSGPGSALGADPNSSLFDVSQLAPALFKLGLAIGILRAVPGDAGKFELNSAWFENPLSQTGQNLSSNGAAIANLLTELLGDLSASALGLPAQDLGTMGIWYPIPDPSTKTATGFYLVNYPVDPAVTDGDQIFGVGILHQWQFDATLVKGGADDNAKIDVRAWGLLPVLKIGQGGMSLVLGQSGYPLNMGVEFAAADQKKIIDTNGLSFNGVKFSAQLDLLGEPKVQLSVVILQLLLPTEIEPADRNLSQIAQITPQEWLSTVATVFISALEQVLGQDSRASCILPIFGLSPIVPGSSVRLPLLDWVDLLSQARLGMPLYTPFVNWFNALLAADAAFPAWMGSIATLLGAGSKDNEQNAVQASGSGTQADPYLVPLMNDARFGCLSLSVVTRVDALGSRFLLPGLNFAGKGQALGSAPAQLLIEAQLDLAQFSLATSGQLGIDTQFLNLRIGIALTNTVPDTPLFEGSVGNAHYVFGALQAGVSVLQSAAAGIRVVPAFYLTGVTTPNGKFDLIDLTQPGQLVDQILDELYTLVDNALLSLFGVDSGSIYGRQAAILLGVMTPQVSADGEGAVWPVDLPAPFSARSLIVSFQNPVAALANYYRAIVQSNELVNQQVPLYYMLNALATLLNSVTGNQLAMTGQGTRADPWLCPLTTETLPASLMAFRETVVQTAVKPGAIAASGSASTSGSTSGADSGTVTLTMGLQLSPSIRFAGSSTLTMCFNLDALSLQFLALADSAPVAQVFPGVSVRLGLPQTVTTPTVAGAAVCVAGAEFVGRWSTVQGWNWNMTVGQPSVIVDGVVMPVGQSMVFSDTDSLQQLVTKQGEMFAPIVVALMGVAVYRTTNRPGLALNGILGLLPQLGAFVPAGLAWPDSMPVLHPTGFTDPTGDIQRQLSALLAVPEYSKAALGLLGWSVSDTAAVPVVSGTGSPDQPFAVPVGLPGEFDLAVWSDTGGQILGLGLQRTFNYSLTVPTDDAQTIDTETRLLLRFVEIPLISGVESNVESNAESNVKSGAENASVASSALRCLPGARLQTQLTPVTPLPIPVSILPGPHAPDEKDGQLNAILLGLEFGLTAGTLTLSPHIQITVTDSAGVHVYDLQQLEGEASQLLVAFYGLVNLAVDQLVTPLLSDSAINNAYQIVAAMNLVMPIATGSEQQAGAVSAGSGRAAIDAAGWNAMLSAPLDFFCQRGIALFTSELMRPKVISLLESITGLHVPTVPLPLLQLFTALELTENQSQGFAPCLYDWVAVAANPVQEVKRRFTRLMDSPVVLAQLVGDLTSQIAPVTWGPVTLSVSQGALVNLRLQTVPPIMLGDILRISGSMDMDFRTNQLRADLGLYCAAVQLDVRSALALTLTEPVRSLFTVDLCWGDSSQPSLQPLVLYPFDPDEFLRQATELAPVFALSTFFTQVVDARLLNSYALARTAMTALGLAFEDADSGLWYTKSPLGLFDDPLGWLLGDAVLGQDGHLNIATLQRVLATVTSTSQASNGVGVKPLLSAAGQPHGVRIFGLPYGQQIDLVADVEAQKFFITPALAEGTTLPLTNGVALQAYTFSLSLGTNFQPGFTGDVILTGKVSPTTTLLLKAGYDKIFRLSAGQVETQRSFDILPFPGWQTLVVDAVQQAAQTLLATLTDTLLTALSNAGAAEFVANLRLAATELEIPDLVTKLVAAGDQGADAVAEAALKWLTGRLSATHAPDTARAVATLLTPYFPSLNADAGLVRYRPSDSLPVTLVTGVQTLGGTLQVGLWVELEVPTGNSIVLHIEPTGVGIPMNADGTPVAGFAPQLHFQMAVMAPIQDNCGPKLTLQFDLQKSIFTLGIDPAGTVAANSSYYRELLPVFFGEPDSSKWGSAVLSWLESLLINIVPRYLSILVLNQSSVSAWLKQPLFGTGLGPSAAQVLLASQLMIQTGGQNSGQNSDANLGQGEKLYMLNSFEALSELTLNQFLAGFLRALLAQEFQLLRIGTSGGIWCGPRPDPVAFPDYFGVRIMVPDLALAAVPYVTFQLGNEATDWISNAGGNPDLKGGISLYVPISATAPDFGKSVLELVNIGLDFHGRDTRNLVQMSRFSMRAVEPRGLITFDFGQSSPVTAFGGGVTLNDIGISLAPNAAVSGDKVNPVAQNLLGSGSGSAADKPNPATNPVFSVNTSYVNKLYVDFFTDDGSSQSQLWFPVQRSFGPIYANKMGVGWEQQDAVLDLLFDGNISLAGLFIGLDSLAVGVPVTNPLDYSAYSLDLAGLDIRFNGGGVEIGGGFLKNEHPLRYDGTATVKVSKFGLMALGSYALVPVDPNLPDGDKAASLFIFANLTIPLGPDPAFFINGLAAGFAYNRNLKIPEPAGINTFPLVQGAINSSVFGGASSTPDSALAVLSEVVYPEIGQYWVAGGVQFSTYQLLNTFALLVLRFGREFAIDLIGITSASFPPKVTPANALAYVELGLLVSFRPSEGMVSARAQLTPNSFLLSQDCRLTGGFAATFWYQGEHAGDFVVTLGGYNPAFKAPAYYPVVPRLGFNWPMSISVGSLNINGGSYFALTPSAIMAGGYLQVLFETGPLRAWFDAGVDFLIQWDPFYFLLGAHVTVGAGFETEIAGVKISLTAQIGAKLVLWGPPIAGAVSVDWYVISFTIPFGDKNQQKPGTQPLAWDTFQQSFLPPLQISSPAAVSLPAQEHNGTYRPYLARVAATMAQNPLPELTQAYAVLKLQATTGLIEDYPGLGWVMQTPFVFSINSVIPATTLGFTDAASTFSGPAIGIQPMAQPSVTTPLLVTLLGWNVEHQSWEPVNLDQRQILVGAQQNGTPEALWSKNVFEPNGVPQAKTIPGAIVGGVLEGSKVVLTAPVGPMDLVTLAYVTLGPLPLPYAFTPVYPVPAVPDQANRARIIANTIMDPVTVVPLRNAIFNALRAFGQPAVDNPSLSVIQFNVTNIYQTPPSLAPLALDLTPLTRQAVTVSLSPPLAAAPTDTLANAATVIGTSRRYRANTIAHAIGAAHSVLPVTRFRTRSTWLAGSAAANVRKVVAASGAGAGTSGFGTGADLSIGLAPGTTSILRLGVNTSRTMQLTGSLPVRLCAFNAVHEPLQHRVADPSVALEHTLPEQSHDVVVMAMGRMDTTSNSGQSRVAPSTVIQGGAVNVPVNGINGDNMETQYKNTQDSQADDTSTYHSDINQNVPGWYYDSEWTRLNHYYFYGDGCLIRPESAPVLQQHKQGQLLASTVLAGNQLRGAHGGLLQGWIETLMLLDADGRMEFSGVLQTVAVLVTGTTIPRVQLCWTDDPANPAYGKQHEVIPQHTMRFGTTLACLYAVPVVPVISAFGEDHAVGRTLAILVHDAGHNADQAVEQTVKHKASPAASIRQSATHQASVQGVLGFAASIDSLCRHGLAGVMQCNSGGPTRGAAYVTSVTSVTSVTPVSSVTSAMPANSTVLASAAATPTASEAALATPVPASVLASRSGYMPPPFSRLHIAQG